MRARGEAFHFNVESLAGRTLELDGRAVSGRAVMRIRDVSGDRLEAARLRERLLRSYSELDALRALLDSTSYPVWLRDRDEKLAWVSAAYVRAVEAKDAADALLRGTELLERTTRDAAIEARKGGTIWRGRAAAVTAGQRRLLDIVEVPVTLGAAGIAADISQIEALRGDMERQTKAHAATLDQLSTAVAIFDRRKRLVFHNSAYRQLWSLPPAFLDEFPSDSEILDRLRAARLLPEQADFRAWKDSVLSAYQAMETIGQVWYLPDGRTLRVVINPNPQGGVTYLFDNVTERFHLESRFNALTRVQSETLDTLKEGVAVFGTDGRLNFFNPAFAQLLKLDPAQLGDKPHIDRIATSCTIFAKDDPVFAAIRSVVTGLDDQRTGYQGRIACQDGTVLDSTAQPLPDGAALLTFIDVTASVNVERALTERNKALIDAERLRNDFVHHVSYELRSPLTNITGFIELLGDPATGPLNAKQRQYAGYVTSSSLALLAIIDNILDLASIDADALELKPEKVDIRETIDLAAEGVQDRLAEFLDPSQGRSLGWSRHVCRRRSAHPANSVQPAFQRHRLLAAGPDGRAVGASAGRRDHPQGQRSGPRHSARGDRRRVQALQDGQPRLEPSRRRPRPVDRALSGRIARRPRRDRFRAQSRHHRDLHISRPGHTLAKAGRDKAGGIAPAAGGQGCICD